MYVNLAVFLKKWAYFCEKYMYILPRDILYYIDIVFLILMEETEYQEQKQAMNRSINIMRRIWSAFHWIYSLQIMSIWKMQLKHLASL